MDFAVAASMADQRSQREDAGVSSNPNDHESLADSLADWRSAERDTVAARSAARVAELALAAAGAAEEAAVEVEAAAASASEAVSRARSAAVRARQAAAQAAEAANLSLTGAQGDKARANHDVDVAEQAEDGS